MELIFETTWKLFYTLCETISETEVVTHSYMSKSALYHFR